MSTLNGLQHWEVIAVAGLLAVGWLAVTSVIGFSVAWLVCREPAAQPAAQPARQPTAATGTLGYVATA